MKTKKERKTKSYENGEKPEEDVVIPIDANSVSTVPSLSDVNPSNDVEKDKKKKKKRNIEIEEQNEVPEPNRENDSKDEKKKKKKRKTESGEENLEGVSETPVEEKPKKKKKRQNDNETFSYGNYIPHTDVENMSTSSAESYRQEHNLTLTPVEMADFYKPITSFSQLVPSLQDYCPEVLQYLEMKKFPHPSPIQVEFRNTYC